MSLSVIVLLCFVDSKWLQDEQFRVLSWHVASSDPTLACSSRMRWIKGSFAGSQVWLHHTHAPWTWKICALCPLVTTATVSTGNWRVWHIFLCPNFLPGIFTVLFKTYNSFCWRCNLWFFNFKIIISGIFTFWIFWIQWMMWFVFSMTKMFNVFLDF